MSLGFIRIFLGQGVSFVLSRTSLLKTSLEQLYSRSQAHRSRVQFGHHLDMAFLDPYAREVQLIDAPKRKATQGIDLEWAAPS